MWSGEVFTFLHGEDVEDGGTKVANDGSTLDWIGSTLAIAVEGEALYLVDDDGANPEVIADLSGTTRRRCASQRSGVMILATHPDLFTVVDIAERSVIGPAQIPGADRLSCIFNSSGRFVVFGDVGVDLATGLVYDFPGSVMIEGDE